MSQRRRGTQRKTSQSSADNRSPYEFDEQPAATSSTRRPLYPNVPKRPTRMSSIDEYEPIQTESRICVMPKDAQSSRLNGTSTMNSNARTRLNLGLINASHERSFSSTESGAESPHERTSKRALSSLDGISQLEQASKRTRPFASDADEDPELSMLLDHRRAKHILSQSAVDESSSQPLPTGRKPTARKLSNAHAKPSSSSQTQPAATLIIEPDSDPEEEPDRERIFLQVDASNACPVADTKPLDAFDPFVKQSPVKSDAPFIPSPLNSTFKRTLAPPVDHSSPCSYDPARRLSLVSSTSMFFETPRSSLSRSTTNASNSPTVLKHDRDTQTPVPFFLEMLNELIIQTHLNTGDPNAKFVDYNPAEVARMFFHQYNPSPPRSVPHPILRLGRYAIEIRYLPTNDRITTQHACDVCLKHFHSSTTAYQRHLAKCLTTHPPGELVYEEHDLGIFRLADTKTNLNQRIFVRSLCRIARLFTNPFRSTDDRHVYYVLCRRDPILHPSQSSLYRLVGYFSQLPAQPGHAVVHNLSSLFILPPHVHEEEYYNLLIAFSYSLLPSSRTLSSPARPLDHASLAFLRVYWRDMAFGYLTHYKPPSMQTIALDTLARHTSIHPRDILSSLCASHSLMADPVDRSSVYLRNDPLRSMRPLNVLMRSLITNARNTDDNLAMDHDSSVAEIVLD